MHYNSCCPQWQIDGMGTRKVQLNFLRRELLYDIANYSFVEGDIMPEDAEHVRHQVTDIVQDGNVDRVTRILNLAYTECVELLYPFVREDIPEDGGELDDRLREPSRYYIELTLPRDFSATTVQLLSHLIHEYLVCRVLADWLSITFPNSYGKWQEKVEALKYSIRTALTSRISKVRRKLKPF